MTNWGLALLTTPFFWGQLWITWIFFEKFYTVPRSNPQLHLLSPQSIIIHVLMVYYLQVLFSELCFFCSLTERSGIKTCVSGVGLGVLSSAGQLMSLWWLLPVSSWPAAALLCLLLDISHLECQMIICELEQFPGTSWWTAHAFQTAGIPNYLEMANKWVFFAFPVFYKLYH